MSLQDFPLSELALVCSLRVDALRAAGLGEALTAPAARDARGIQADQVSFLVLAYACCVNHASWLVRHEACRLGCLVETLTPAEKVAVLAVLQLEARPVAAALDVRAFAQTRDLGAFHVVAFEDAAPLVAERQVVLHAGSAFVANAQLGTLILLTYKARLAVFLRRCRTRLEQIGRTNTAYYAPQFSTILSVMHATQKRVCPVAACDAGALACTAQTLPAAIGTFAPLCIVRLAAELRSRGHLTDKKRLTLRLWLCAAKVRLDVAVEFWQTQVPEKQDVRAPLTQVYAKRYACVGCAKIRGLGLCPFQASEKGLLAWCADAMPSAVRDIEDILAGTQCPSERCGRFFALRYAPRACNHPGNPANYFLRAAEAGLQ
jgi:DNA primase large subunit